jgi:hypothetical protein
LKNPSFSNSFTTLSSKNLLGFKFLGFRAGLRALFENELQQLYRTGTLLAVEILLIIFSRADHCLCAELASVGAKASRLDLPGLGLLSFLS